MLILKRVCVLSLTICLLGACSLQVQGGSQTAAPLPQETLPDLSGTWTGTFTDNSGIPSAIYPLTMTLTQAADATASGNLEFTYPDRVDDQTISGTFDGVTFHFTDADGRYYSAVYTDGTLSGAVSWTCYDCPDQSWALISLTRGAPAAVPGSGEATLPAVAAADLSGEWVGNMIDWTAEFPEVLSFDLDLVQVADNSVSGTLTYASTIDPANTGQMTLNGSFDGVSLQIMETGGRNRTFSMTYDGNVLWGDAGLDDFEQANRWGQIIMIPMIPSMEEPIDVAISGTWTGTYDEHPTGDRVFDLTLVITQVPADGSFCGIMQLTLDDVPYMDMLLHGQVDGTHLTFNDYNDPTGYFWADVSAGLMTGFASLSCSDCPDQVQSSFTVYQPY